MNTCNFNIISGILETSDFIKGHAIMYSRDVKNRSNIMDTHNWITGIDSMNKLA